MRELWGKVVREYRERAGLTMSDLERGAGVNRSLQSRYERGIDAPPEDPERVEKMADAVKVPEAERRHFHDLARLSRGALPTDVAEQEGAEEYILPAIDKARKARGE